MFPDKYTRITSVPHSGTPIAWSDCRTGNKKHRLRTANGLNTMGIHYDYTHSVHCSQTKNANLIRHIALFSHFCYDLGNKKISLAVTSEI